MEKHVGIRILDSIANLVRPDEVDRWLVVPQVRLGGRSPFQVIGKRDVEAQALLHDLQRLEEGIPS